MTEILPLAMAFAAGAALGTGFFLGLWATLRRLPATRHPMLLVSASLALRMAVLVLCAWPVARAGRWDLLLAAGAGLALARWGIARRLALRPGAQEMPREEAP